MRRVVVGDTARSEARHDQAARAAGACARVALEPVFCPSGAKATKASRLLRSRFRLGPTRTRTRTSLPTLRTSLTTLVRPARPFWACAATSSSSPRGAAAGGASHRDGGARAPRAARDPGGRRHAADQVAAAVADRRGAHQRLRAPGPAGAGQQRAARRHPPAARPAARDRDSGGHGPAHRAHRAVASHERGTPRVRATRVRSLYRSLMVCSSRLHYETLQTARRPGPGVAGSVRAGRRRAGGPAARQPAAAGGGPDGRAAVHHDDRRHVPQVPAIGAAPARPEGVRNRRAADRRPRRSPS